MTRSTIVAALAAVAMAFGCAQPPEPPQAQHIDAVESLPFHTPSMVQFKAVEAGSTYMQRLIEHVPVDAVNAPNALRSERDRWVIDRGAVPTDDVFLSAPTRADLERFVASVPSLTLPADRQLAYGRIDDSDRWRTYVVDSTAALDGDDIAHAEVTRDRASDRITAFVDFTPDGAQQFAHVTENMVGSKLAVLLDGSVVAAPVIMGKITGGRAQVTFAR